MKIVYVANNYIIMCFSFRQQTDQKLKELRGISLSLVGEPSTIT